MPTIKLILILVKGLECSYDLLLMIIVCLIVSQTRLSGGQGIEMLCATALNQFFHDPVTRRRSFDVSPSGNVGTKPVFGHTSGLTKFTSEKRQQQRQQRMRAYLPEIIVSMPSEDATTVPDDNVTLCQPLLTSRRHHSTDVSDATCDLRERLSDDVLLQTLPWNPRKRVSICSGLKVPFRDMKLFRMKSTKQPLKSTDSHLANLMMAKAGSEGILDSLTATSSLDEITQAVGSVISRPASQSLIMLDFAVPRATIRRQQQQQQQHLPSVQPLRVGVLPRGHHHHHHHSVSETEIPRSVTGEHNNVALSAKTRGMSVSLELEQSRNSAPDLGTCPELSTFSIDTAETSDDSSCKGRQECQGILRLLSPESPDSSPIRRCPPSPPAPSPIFSDPAGNTEPDSVTMERKRQEIDLLKRKLQELENELKVVKEEETPSIFV